MALTNGSNLTIGTGSLLIVSSSQFVSGSIIVTGSVNITGSGILNNRRILTDLDTGSFATTGSNTFNGNVTISGSLSVSQSVNINDGFYVNGNKQFNYGQFSDNTIQSGSANTAYSMKLNTTDLANNISIVDGTKITFAYTGIYNLQFSAQFTNNDNTNENIDVWFALTGSNISNSNTRLAINKAQAGNKGEIVAAWNILLPVSASNYAEIKWSTTGDNVKILSQTTPSGPTRPSIPSVIATITQIA
jgi:hypothetical protein